MSYWPVSKIRVASWAERTGQRPDTPAVSNPAVSGKEVPQQSSGYPSLASSQGTILIVDDDASVRRALHTTLQTLGFSTSEASGGEEALMLARTAPYDVVLLDINMPGNGRPGKLPPASPATTA